MITYPVNAYQSFTSPLLTDFYQLTMAYGYWKKGIQDQEAVFHLNFRRNPFQGGFAVAAGLETLIHYLQSFRFQETDLSYLASLKGSTGEPIFCQEFLNYLSTIQFSCHLDAVPEGTVVFPYEPLVRVQGPILQCQLLESALLNLINFPTLIATKAARVRLSAKNDEVIEFGLRRAQGVDGAVTASRAAYVGGCDATSNVLAGQLFGIPVRGTHGHSWVMAFEDEMEAFQAYADVLPDHCIFLVDTYNTLDGVRNAIAIGKELRARGHELMGIRLDSGDLAYLSIEARKMLDEAGFQTSAIVASNELDETLIAELKKQDAKVTIWGVGTSLVTGREQPSLDGVYKLSAIRDGQGVWNYKLKLSEQMVKISNPGILQVRRFFKPNEGEYAADMIYDTQIGANPPVHLIDPLDPTRQKFLTTGLESKDLLEPIFRGGQLVYQIPTLQEARQHTLAELARFHSSIKRFVNPHTYIVGMEKKLYDLKIELIKKIRGHMATGMKMAERS